MLIQYLIEFTWKKRLILLHVELLYFSVAYKNPARASLLDAWGFNILMYNYFTL